MRLSTRLLLAFGAIVLLSIASSAFALFELKKSADAMADVVKENNVKIALANDMGHSIHVVSRIIRTVALLTDEAEMGHEKEKIVSARAAYDKARAELEKYPASDAAKASRATIDAAAGKARPLNNAALELALENKAAEAIALLLKQAAPATNAWQAALDDNVAMLTKENAARYEEAQAAYASARNLLIATAVVSALISFGLALLVVRGIARELGGEPSEVAAMARSVADSDLSAPIVVRDGDSISVVAAMARMQASLSGIVRTVRGNAESVATASAQIAHGNQDLSQRTEEQASALEQTAATMHELGETVRHNADNARQASQLAQTATGVAVKGGEVVGQVVDTMRGINESSRQIAEIITVIDGIAFQTNILALNAAVEAARAGEQGRGFAVVASEVRTLAQRSASAAKEIKTLITASVEQVEQGSALVDQAGRTMGEIVGSIKRVSDIVGEISAASTEQSNGVSQVGEAVSQMDQVTQQNAALVEESAAAATSLQHQAEELVRTVAVFKLHQTAGEPVPSSLTAAFSGTERRGPHRASNVTRPNFAAKAKAAAKRAPAPEAGEANPLPKTGTDDWERF